VEMIESVRRAAAHGEDLVLKIGMHLGPSIAVQSNNQLDYFGRTVNIAARVQALAGGGEIVCSEEVWQAPGVQQIAAGRGLHVRQEKAPLKGIGERMTLRRIAVLSPAARGAPQPPQRTRADARASAGPRKTRAAARPKRGKISASSARRKRAKAS